MDLKIRDWLLDDQPFINECMVALQKYLVPLDPDNLITCPYDYGPRYGEDLTRRIREANGKILVASLKTQAIGMIAAVIRATPEHEQVVSYLNGKEKSWNCMFKKLIEAVESPNR